MIPHRTFAVDVHKFLSMKVVSNAVSMTMALLAHAKNALKDLSLLQN